VTAGFSPLRRGGAHAQFEPAEAGLLASLARQVVELLRDGVPDPQVAEADGDPLAQLVGVDGPADPPDDPVLARLLPDGYSDADPTAPHDDGGELADANADFRRYTEPGLRDGKVATAQSVIAALHEAGADDPDQPVDVELDADGVQSWLRCLTDLRLAIGTRLGVEQDDEDRWESLPPDDAARGMHEVYDWLGYVQETLVRTLP